MSDTFHIIAEFQQTIKGCYEQQTVTIPRLGHCLLLEIYHQVHALSAVPRVTVYVPRLLLFVQDPVHNNYVATDSNRHILNIPHTFIVVGFEKTECKTQCNRIHWIKYNKT